jgi:hypothetical protein
MKTFALCVVGICALMLLSPRMAHAVGTDISAPANAQKFGTGVTVLPNGNFVVVDPFYDLPGPINDVGAVFLYSADGTLLSTTTGSTENDYVGAQVFDIGGGILFASPKITVLTDGHFVIASPHWDNGGVADAGAVTFGHSSAGGPATVSPANSAVGSTTNDLGADQGGPTILPLKFGRYLIICPGWDNGAAVDAGAVRRVIGFLDGPFDATNSLVGSTTGDSIGSHGVTVLPSGDFVVISPYWDDPSGPTPNVGAVTWGLGGEVFAFAGTVTSNSSLIGSTENDRVGEGGVTVLANGHYVVGSPGWDDSANSRVDVGAVTWCSSSFPTFAWVAASNSLIGGATNAAVGQGGITALTNGHYVVLSPSYDNPSPLTANVGAATWCDGTGPTSTFVNIMNSLIGTSANDQVGMGALALSNGNYVVSSPSWINAGMFNAGAATWCNGAAPTFGEVSELNSLVGTQTDSYVGPAAALPNGNYLVTSPNWVNGELDAVGAVTWGNGATGTKGKVSAANSLTGTQHGDSVGGGGIYILTNGNFLVRSPNWKNGSAANAGAVTWGNGTTGISGVVSPANSLVGTAANDNVSGNGCYPLANGNYVVLSTGWSSGRGAATWGNGTTGVAGPVTAANSLVGTTPNDFVGNYVPTQLANGHYVMVSSNWNDQAGAVTWCNGTTGTVGPVSPLNSLVGTTANDRVGEGGAFPQTDGSYTVLSRDWNNGATTMAGAVTPGKGTGGTVGPVTTANSVVGTTQGRNAGDPLGPAGGPLMTVAYDPGRSQVIVGRPDDNTVTRLGSSGTVSFASPLYTVVEGDSLSVSIIRTAGTEGAISVNLSTTSVGGTATVGSDYNIKINEPVDFPDGVALQQVAVSVSPGVPNEIPETFKLTLSGGTAVIGSPATTTVRIIDSDGTTDVAAPPAPVIQAPLALARVGVNSGGSTTISGTASDNKGIIKVEVSLNGGPFVQATLADNNGPNINWSASVTPVAGANTVVARSTDASLNQSLVAKRTFIVTRPLVVRPLGNGTVSPVGFVPASFREVGRLHTLTATPAAGFLFDRWSVTGPPNALNQVGLSADALLRPTLTFIFREALQLSPVFRPNPFNIQVAGTFNGGIRAHALLPDRPPPEPDGTLPSPATEGSCKITVLATGGFSGTLTIDGAALRVAGIFDADGVARFGTNRTSTLSVARANKPSLLVTLQMTTTPLTASITGRVTQHGANPLVPLAVSEVTADRASYNGTNVSVPQQLLGATTGASGMYTVILRPRSASLQPGGISSAEFPQGEGFVLLTLTKTGALSFSGNLPDNTPLTGSTTLSQAKTCRLFAQLYNKQGIFASTVTFDTVPSDTDVTAPQAHWFRPIQDAQHYPLGWTNGLIMDVFGARYVPVAGFPVIALPFPDVDGNADLEFLAGLLPIVESHDVTIAGNDVVTRITEPDTYTVAINRALARLTGTFTHDLFIPTKPAFQAMFYSKGSLVGAYGYFLTPTPKVKDYTGQGGRVKLTPQ